MRQHFKIFLQLLGRYRARAAAVSFLRALSGGMEAGAMMLLIPILNFGFGGTTGEAGSQATSWAFRWLYSLPVTDSHKFSISVGSFLALALLSQALRLIAEWTMLDIVTHIEESCINSTVKGAVRTQWPYYINLGIGDLNSGTVTEGAACAIGLMHLMESIGFALTALGMFLVAGIVAPRECLITILFICFIQPMYRAFSRRSSQSAGTISARQSAIASLTNEIFTNLKFWKSTATSPIIVNSLLEATSAFRRQRFSVMYLSRLSRSLFFSSGALFISSILLLTYWYRVESFAQTLVLLGIFTRLFPNVQWFQTLLLQSVEYRSAAIRWMNRQELLQTHQENFPGNVVPTYFNQISLRKVAFRYPLGNNSFNLKGIDLDITRGSLCVVSGPSGTGKTTLVDLLTGLIEPTEGTISIDGTPLSQIDITLWRRRIGLVLQDTPLIRGTVLDNITWKDAEPNIEHATECAKKANALEFIEQLPKGILTDVAERGARLSGGQRQKIAIARALYRKPWLLILDEPTSALDPATEAELLHTIESLRGSVTTLLITHRQVSFKHADKFLQIKKGKLILEKPVRQNRPRRRAA